MKVVIMFFLSTVFFLIYFSAFKFLYTSIIPWNTATDFLAIILALGVIIPISYLTAEKTVDAIKSLPR